MKLSKKIFSLIAVLAVLGIATKAVAGLRPLTSSDGIPFILCSLEPYVGDKKIQSYNWLKGARFVVSERDQAIFDNLMGYLDHGAPTLSLSNYRSEMTLTNPEGTVAIIRIQFNANETIFIKKKEMGVERVIMTSTLPSPATIGGDPLFPSLKLILNISTVCGDSNGDLK